MTENPPQWIVLAQLLRPQGRKGELLAELLTDFPERFDDQPRVFLAPANFAGSEDAARRATITSFWLPVGRNVGRIVLEFAGIDSITKAEALNGLEVIVPAEERLELDEESEYIADLIGCAVYDGDRRIGTVEGVDFPTTPDGARRLEEAAPLLTVLGEDGLEVLIPYVKAYLREVSVEAKRIDMTLPVGLVELNR
ncbi:16S rRNA processing protein RimM [Granulicella sp. WH15]|uniref:ribosome maturation factor RimM n=1 Tax=Granulicella sp. WH15 TaxID=2602070 RepID=UPI001366B8A8|nr:ribosome maturation factor RimM [Granulicella sp. WH15]QHN04810.1 16S rRNA processing protein RimM [Granulicella sp. WH15]